MRKSIAPPVRRTLDHDAVFLAAMANSLHFFSTVFFRELHRHNTFIDNWHIKVMAAELQAVALGETPRLILNVPPRSLKSWLATVCMPVWYLGHHPGGEVMCASYAKSLAETFALDARRIMNTPLYQAIFPTRLISPRCAVNDLKTTEGGCRFATGLDGGITGRGADLLIVDDPLKPDEARSDTQRVSANQWFDGTANSRANNKRDSRTALVMQRLHLDDLSGHLLDGASDWRHISLPAIALEDETFTTELFGKVRTYTRKAGEVLHLERESLESLHATRDAIGVEYFNTQYQQQPSAPDGNQVKITWFGRYAEMPAKFDRVIQSWDTASSVEELSSYSVGVTLGVKGKQVYVLNVYRKRMEFPELKRVIKEQAELFEANVVLIENKSSGISILQQLQSEGFWKARAVEPKKDKAMRLADQSMFIESGLVWLPKEAAWLAEFESELLLFPQSKHSDQVDALTQGLQYVRDLSKDTGLLEYYTELNRRQRIEDGLPPDLL